MALQVFNAIDPYGKPVVNILYGQMSGWSSRGSSDRTLELHIDMFDPEDPKKKNVLKSFYRYATPLAAEIVAAIDDSAAMMATAVQDQNQAKAKRARSTVEKQILEEADVRVSVLKLANVREAADLTSELVDTMHGSVLKKGTVFTVLEATRVIVPVRLRHSYIVYTCLAIDRSLSDDCRYSPTAGIMMMTSSTARRKVSKACIHKS